MTHENISPEAWIPKVVKQPFSLLGPSCGSCEHRDRLQGHGVLHQCLQAASVGILLTSLLTYVEGKTPISALNLKTVSRKKEQKV